MWYYFTFGKLDMHMSYNNYNWIRFTQELAHLFQVMKTQHELWDKCGQWSCGNAEPHIRRGMQVTVLNRHNILITTTYRLYLLRHWWKSQLSENFYSQDSLITDSAANETKHQWNKKTFIKGWLNIWSHAGIIHNHLLLYDNQKADWHLYTVLQKTFIFFISLYLFFLQKLTDFRNIWHTVSRKLAFSVSHGIRWPGAR